NAPRVGFACLTLDYAGRLRIHLTNAYEETAFSKPKRSPSNLPGLALATHSKIVVQAVGNQAQQLCHPTHLPRNDGVRHAAAYCTICNGGKLIGWHQEWHFVRVLGRHGGLNKPWR